MKRFNKRTLLALPLTGILILAACGSNDNESADNTGADNNGANTEETDGLLDDEATEEGNNEIEAEAAIDLDGDPEEPIATVNGEEILLGEFREMMEQMAAQQGMNIEDEETAAMLAQMQEPLLDQLVTQKIMLQEVEAQNIEANEEDVEAELEQFRAQFEDEEELEELLSEMDYTMEEVEEEIWEFYQLQELRTLNHLDEDEISVSEEEVQAQYEQASMQNPEIGEFEDVEEEMETQAKQIKFEQELRDNADIEILI